MTILEVVTLLLGAVLGWASGSFKASLHSWPRQRRCSTSEEAGAPVSTIAAVLRQAAEPRRDQVSHPAR